MAGIPFWLSTTGATGSNVLAGYDFHYIFASGPLADPQTTEAVRRVRHRTPGVWSGMFVDVISNTIASGSSTVTSRINGATGGQSISIPFGATGHFEDASGSDSIAAGDDVGFRVAGGPSGTAICLRTLGGAFAASSNTVTRMSTCSDSLLTTTAYFGGVTGTTLGTTESLYQTLIKTPATFKNASVYVDSNSRNGDSVMVLRVNGADTALTITIPASTTGTFEDTTHSVAVVDGDLVCWRLQAAGSSGGCSCITLGVDQETTDGTATFSGWRQVPLSPGTTTYVPILGGQNVASETDAAHRVQVTGTLSRLSYCPVSNSLNGDTTLRLRINGGYGNQIVTIAAGVTGQIEDSSGSDVVSAGDDIAIEIDTSASSSGAMTFGLHGILWGPPKRVGCFTAGAYANVEATLAALFSLDGNVNTLSEPNTFQVNGNVKFPTLPTSDPGISGALWNNGGTLQVSP